MCINICIICGKSNEKSLCDDCSKKKKKKKGVKRVI